MNDDTMVNVDGCPECGSRHYNEDPILWRLADDEVHCLNCGANYIRIDDEDKGDRLSVLD